MIIKTKERAHLLFVVDVKSTHSLQLLSDLLMLSCNSGTHEGNTLFTIILSIIDLILFEVILILTGCFHLQCANTVSGAVLPDLLGCNLKQTHPGVSHNCPSHQNFCILLCPSIIILLFSQVPKYLDLNPGLSGPSCLQVYSLEKLVL